MAEVQTNRGRPGNPLALGLVLVGAAALAIAAFLPLDEPSNSLRMVQDNTLIQHGHWGIIGLAVGIAGSGFLASQRNGKWPLTVLLCLVAGAEVFLHFTNTAERTLYPIGPNGAPDTTQPGTTTALGIALYVAGAGVAVALMGALGLRQQERVAKAIGGNDDAGPVQTPTKKCPDCAETILADANVCKHCGYRFTPTSAPKATPKPAPAKSTKVKCSHCQHLQVVPLSQRSFVCDECGRLKEVNVTRPDDEAETSCGG
jgi:Uncharacterised protein family UPF0547